MGQGSYQGSCLCGGVELTLHGAIDSVIHCHCSRCRKSSGTAYATNGFVATKDLELTKGADLLTAYQSAPGKYRYFCRVCGSPIYSRNEAQPDRLRIRLGVLDSAISERPLSHNFVSSKADWDDLDAQLPRYDGYEPGR